MVWAIRRESKADEPADAPERPKAVHTCVTEFMAKVVETPSSSNYRIQYHGTRPARPVCALCVRGEKKTPPPKKR